MKTSNRTASQLRLYHRLQQVAHRLSKQADRRLLAQVDLTTAQAAVLAVIDLDGEPTQQGVAQRLGLNRSAITSMVGRLSDRGYLARVPNPADGRSWILQLTPVGRRVLNRAARPFDEINARLESALSEQEMRQLAKSLDRLMAELDDE